MASIPGLADSVPFLYSNGSYRDLSQMLSPDQVGGVRVTAINHLGTIVGQAEVSNAGGGFYPGVISTGGGAFSTFSLPIPNDAFLAGAINGLGQIAGTYNAIDPITH